MSMVLFTWLIQSALASTVILVCGLLAARLCRQPADVVRVAQWTLATTLAAIVLVCCPSLAIMSLGLVDAGGIAGPGMPSVIGDAALPPMPSERVDQGQLGVATDAAGDVEKPVDERSRRASATSAISGAAETSRGLGEWAVVILVALYLTGCGAMLFVWIAGLVELRRIRCRALPAALSVERTFAQVTKLQNSDIRLLVSNELAAPIMWGVRRPVIVLPSACCDDPDPTRLRYCLAHEWSHVVRRDFVTWQLATVLQMVLYYHPLFWRVRRLLALANRRLTTPNTY